MRKNCVDMCARDGRGVIEICLSEKGALAKNRLGNTALDAWRDSLQWFGTSGLQMLDLCLSCR